MLRQFELVERVKAYDPNADEDGLNRAYVFALKMRGAKEGGEVFYSHPVEVAGILTNYRLDYATIVTALLHDTLENTSTTYEDLEKLFGEEIAGLVEGVTRLSQIHKRNDSANEAKQAENFRKLLLAMSDDIRVLLVKLADRLHDMRTIENLKDPSSRQIMAEETLDIYAPLAERIGMQEMKTELENIAFRELKREAYDSIKLRLSFLESQDTGIIDEIVVQLKKDMEEGGLSADVYGREKSPYSIWRKMQKNNIAFEQLSDIMAFRVIVDTVAECYQALGIIHTKYQMVPGRYKDYISTPKKNGYKSLHTGVIGPKKYRIEVQIRTKEMHRIAEYGVAAHWEYKQGAHKDGRQFTWMRELLDLLDQTDDPEEFLENTKLAMYNDQVFCFTPKGDLVSLPKNATPIDFAYDLHSGLGNRVVGAKINGQLKPLKTILNNGDQVELLTSKVQNPSPEWERFVVTAKARSAIKKFIREQKRRQFMELGRQIIQKAFKDEGKIFEEEMLSKILNNYRVGNIEDLYVKVGEGINTGTEIFDSLFPDHRRSALGKVLRTFTGRDKKKKTKSDKVVIKGLIPGIVINYAKCCHPLPGDRIVGIITTGKGVTIHTADCKMLKIHKNEPERWIDVDWDDGSFAENDEPYIGRLKLIVTNRSDTLGVLSALISKEDSEIINMNIISRDAGFMEMTMDIEVKNAEHLNDIIVLLRSSPTVSSVKRNNE